MTSLTHGIRGRPLKLGNQLDQLIKTTVKNRMDSGLAMDIMRVAAIARGVIKVHRPITSAALLPHITTAWAKSMMSRMSLVKRKCKCTSSKKIIVIFKMNCQFTDQSLALVTQLYFR